MVAHGSIPYLRGSDLCVTVTLTEVSGTVYPHAFIRASSHVYLPTVPRASSSVYWVRRSVHPLTTTCLVACLSDMCVPFLCLANYVRICHYVRITHPRNDVRVWLSRRSQSCRLQLVALTKSP